MIEKYRDMLESRALGFKGEQIRYVFSGEDVFRAKDVQTLFAWNRDVVVAERTGLFKVTFFHWLEAGATYRFHPAIRPSKRSSSLTLWPAEAWENGVDENVFDYMAKKKLRSE